MPSGRETARKDPFNAVPLPTSGETMTRLYGIPNCDTMKKARTWLTEHKVGL